MGLTESARMAYRSLRNAGPTAILEALSHGYHRLRRLEGTPVYADEWDALVVLDACRADLWNEVAPEFDRFGDAETRTSVAGTSTEWLEATFGTASPLSLDQIAYVTGNPYSDDYCDGEAFARLDEVWRYAWDDELGTIPARPITDRAIAAGRDGDHRRLVVHYMQPHFPSVCDPDATGRMDLDSFGERPVSIWERLRFGEVSRDRVWELYRDNLRYVLEEVELLLENLDADRVAITADHGNAVGEAWLHGHAEGLALPALREVPWFVTDARDEATHEPADYRRADDGSVGDRLRALGYAE